MVWTVKVLGSLREDAEYEISVLNEKGAQTSWGWGDENKIILFSNGGDNELNPGTKEQFKFAKKVAKLLCDSLNKGTLK